MIIIPEVPPKINTYDIDGVIFINKDIQGLTPTPNDIIITGRSYEEHEETYKMLSERGIHNQVFYNSLKFDEKTRESSGFHKGKVLNMLKKHYDIQVHFEDDEIQIEQIKLIAPWVNIIHIKHDLTYKENMRHV
jgi:hypothetical protein